MLDELLQHKRQLHRLKTDSDYLKEMLETRLADKAGYGESLKEHLRQWVLLLNESYENFDKAYGWVIDILRYET